MKLIASDGLETGESELNFPPLFVSLSLLSFISLLFLSFHHYKTVNSHSVVVVVVVGLQCAFYDMNMLVCNTQPTLWLR